MTRVMWWLAFALAACGTPSTKPVGPSATAAAPPDPHRPGNDLAAPAAFAGIADRDARARAVFAEATRVFAHPRCANCHPADDSPRQGDGHRLHDPPVVRGIANRGVPGMECATCHQDRNAMIARVPGAPNWRLAPTAMAWLGRSPAQICVQLKDPARNGGRALPAIVDHVAHDELVAWGWAPGADRTPAPGSAAQLAALVQTWIEAGAACPEGN